MHRKANVFLDHLSAAEAGAFLALARLVVLADGSLSDEEAPALAALTKALDFPPAPAGDTVAELAALFTNRRAQVSALLELMGLGFVDGQYHPVEREIIGEVAAAFGVGAAELLAMEGWVIRQGVLMREAAGFWAEDA